jgi:crotonobetainyl-CoA:carnitine CoA-transferase CaiB-like acyl-CoA transferase
MADRGNVGSPSGPGAASPGPGAGGPLVGLRVVELGTLVAGPFLGRLLADFGAEVIKVEPPGQGDPMREWGPNRYQGRPLWWPVQSRNKKLITLDLRRSEGAELARRLVAVSDVLIENFRPGTLEGWGLGPDQLLELNPALVIARVSGYGQTGPYAARPGFASAGEAMGGLRYINGYPGEAPPRMGISLGDSLAAMFAVQGVLMALYDREAHGGRGQVVDASILESCFALLESMVPEYAKLGVTREPAGTGLEGVAPSNVYRSRDGRWIVIAANSPNLWQRLCQAIGRPDLLEDERFRTHWDRGRNRHLLDEIMAAWVEQRDAAEVDQAMSDAGVVCGPVYSIADIFHDPHYRSRDMFLTLEDPELGELVVPGIVPKLSRTPGEVRHPGPWQLGAHNREVYCGLLGLSEAELEELSAAGLV